MNQAAVLCLLNGVMFQKKEIFIITAVRISGPTYKIIALNILVYVARVAECWSFLDSKSRARLPPQEVAALKIHSY
jgi:hypothetical protein